MTTSSAQNDFGELRAMLEQIPSITGFNILLAFFEHHADRDEVKLRWLPYALQKLDHSWPDGTRQCPKPLLAEYERGEVVWCPLVRALDFEGERLNKKRVEAMVASTHMGDVTQVSLRSCHIRWPQLVELSAHSPFGQLDSLDFYKSTKLSDSDRADLIRVFESPMLSSLKGLSLNYWRALKAADYEIFAEHLPMSDLKTLNFDGGKSVISPRRFGALLATGQLDRLEHISLDHHGIQDAYEGMLAVLSTREELAHLQTLTVAGCSAKDFKVFAKATHFERLQKLELLFINDAYEEFVAWLKGASLPHLEHLAIHFNDVGLAVGWQERKQDVFDALVTSPLVKQLDSLSLNFDHGLPDIQGLLGHARAREALSGLSRFAWRVQQDHQASHTRQDAYVSETIAAIAAFPFEQLHALYVNFSWREGSQSRETLAPLARSPWFGKLDSLQLYGGALDSSHIFALLSDCPDLALRILGGHTDFDREMDWTPLLEDVNGSRLEVLDFDVPDAQDLISLRDALSQDLSSLPALRRFIGSSVWRDLYEYTLAFGDREMLATYPRWVAIDLDSTDRSWIDV